MKRIIILSLAILLSLASYAQTKMKKPSLMVVPSKGWMNQEGHMKQFNNQGSMENHPNFRKALEEDLTLVQVLTNLSGTLTERGFTIKMLEAQLDKLDAKMADQSMRTTGGGVTLNPTDMLKMTAKADIIIEISYTINQRGPRKSVQFTLLGKDAGQGTMAGPATGNTPESAGSVPELMSSALNLYMDGFCSSLQKYFDKMLAQGREISLNINTTEAFGDDLYTEDYGDDELMLLIEDWVADNTKNGAYNLSDATETMMVFDMTRIPLTYMRKGKERALDAGAFGKNLEKYLESLGLTAKSERTNLSEVTVYIGTF